MVSRSPTGGYLLAHFREDPTGYAERIHFSLSDGDTPLRWLSLNGGRPVLTSDLGTTGVRDPAIVRDVDGRFHIIATDLRVFGGDNRGWDGWRRHGSRSLILWDSDDLWQWSAPRAVEVAPPTAGMAWAPEVDVDPSTGENIVFWSSTLFDPADVAHEGETYSRILFSSTRDFVAFSPAKVLVDAGIDVIDTAVAHADGRASRFSKHEDRGDGSRGIYQEVGSSIFADDFGIVAQNIGADIHRALEAPMLVEHAADGRWYLFLDRYGTEQGYIAFVSDDLHSGRWRAVPPELTAIPAATKHGTILRIDAEEWERLRRYA
jgi:hypothetical protein